MMGSWLRMRGWLGFVAVKTPLHLPGLLRYIPSLSHSAIRNINQKSLFDNEVVETLHHEP